MEGVFDGRNWDNDLVKHKQSAIPNLVSFSLGPYWMLEGVVLNGGESLSKKLKGNCRMTVIKFEKAMGKVGVYNLTRWQRGVREGLLCGHGVGFNSV